MITIFLNLADCQDKNIDLLIILFYKLQIILFYKLYNKYYKFSQPGPSTWKTESPGTEFNELREVVEAPTAGSNELEIESMI